MKCLSFLGTGQLRETRYRFEDKVCETPVVQEALASFFPIEEMVFFVTRQAEERNYHQVLARCPSGKKVSVPEGRSEAELWQIFTIVADEVKEGDTIIFDITHGLRSLPFIALLSAAYLQEVKGATLAALVYGAFDVTEGSETPIFDLSGFLQIFDWMAGVKSFMNHADAREIRTLVQKIAAAQFLSSGGKEGPTQIAAFAGKLEGFTSAV
ncbi:MAG TPA: TIGR02221 family CRISPR-associated protein, partial [Methanospirillum sp.]|nr:TIGR02221 family CRISPR-associated protein [Methanospirillum sp.]